VPSAGGHHHILTGGTLATRLANAEFFSQHFPASTFVVVSPLMEGRLTVDAGEGEILRMLQSSAGTITHALVIAKGSTDLHLAWLSTSGRSKSDGAALSAVHKAGANEPSRAIDLFSGFVQLAVNSPCVDAARCGACALIFAGVAAHALGGKRVAARGRYFRRVPQSELQSAEEEKACFERFVALDWNASVAGAPCNTSFTSKEDTIASQKGRAAGVATNKFNPVFIGALGTSKPRLDAVV